jgi:hypothetical protein
MVARDTNLSRAFSAQTAFRKILNKYKMAGDSLMN